MLRRLNDHKLMLNENLSEYLEDLNSIDRNSLAMYRQYPPDDLVPKFQQTQKEKKQVLKG